MPITIVSPSVKISEYDDKAIATALEKIEDAARKCHKADKKGEVTSEEYVRSKIKAGHLSVIEHVNVTVTVVCDRGVTHEIVRHRIGSYSQESTRFVNYVKKGGCVFIKPSFFKNIPTGTFESFKDMYSIPMSSNEITWVRTMFYLAEQYTNMINEGCSPQEARSVLPNSTKTTIEITYNLREWRHFLALRSLGVAGIPHPQMKEIADIILLEFQRLIPGVFENLDIDKRRLDFIKRISALMPKDQRILISRAPEVLKDFVFEAQGLI
ncbi:FAD-dependent thymidylate synthase [Candidatus Pacearchaeota archaeon]|nr:FAD-dependent thymidylate synthase [Candidatus Pacearchaeota archaeon]